MSETIFFGSIHFFFITNVQLVVAIFCLCFLNSFLFVHQLKQKMEHFSAAEVPMVIILWYFGGLGGGGIFLKLLGTAECLVGGQCGFCCVFSSILVDYNLYRKFWSLQDYFRKPVQCYDKAAWRAFAMVCSWVCLSLSVTYVHFHWWHKFTEWSCFLGHD